MGGRYVGAMTTGSNTVAYGHNFGALPNGHVYPTPLATRCLLCRAWTRMVQQQLSSRPVSCLMHRFALGGPLNLRLSPQLVATERDVINSLILDCPEEGH